MRKTESFHFIHNKKYIVNQTQRNRIDRSILFDEGTNFHKKRYIIYLYTVQWRE